MGLRLGRGCSRVLSISSFDVKIKELQFGAGEGLEVRSKRLLPDAVVKRNHAEHARLPDAGILVVVRLHRRHTGCYII